MRLLRMENGRQRGVVIQENERPALRRAFKWEKAPRPMRGWPQNPFLDRSLVGRYRGCQGGKPKSVWVQVH
jgi:hypothetical protein